MSLVKKSNNASYLSSNYKVIQYLQSSPHRSTFQTSSSNDLFNIKQSLNEHHLCSHSEDDSISSSSSSILASSLSDPIAYCSINGSSSEELDFNHGFDHQISDDDFDEGISDENHDTATLLGESNIDASINELELLLHQCSNSTILNDDDNGTPQHRCASFLHDSTYTLCSQDQFSAYTDVEENEEIRIRSNSLDIIQFDETSNLLDKPPKKAVRFADMLGLDLESIRYMTPPDHSTTSLFHECIRLKIEQLRLAKNQMTAANLCTQSSPSTCSKQYNIVSKNFSPPINIIPLIYDQQIMLECLYTKDSSVYGRIRVHNCAYDKNVFVRVSHNEWETFDDIQARHSMSYSNDNTDTFIFEINLAKANVDTTVPKRILFAVYLQAMRQEFWDNNRGWNYVLDVFARP